MSGRTKGENKKAVEPDEAKKTPRGRLRKSPSRSEQPASPGRPKRTSAKRAGSKSPARKTNSSPVRRKSPARKRSPGRITPGRKSPSRVSPLRTRSETEKKIDIKITTSTPILDIDSDSDIETEVTKPVIQVRSRLRKVNAEITPVKSIESRDTINSDRSDKFFLRPRKSASRDSEKIVHLNDDYFTKSETKLTEKLSHFSDEDDIFTQKTITVPLESILLPKRVNFSSRFYTEFGGFFGSIFFIFFLPIFTLAIVNVSDKKIQDSDYHKKLSTYFDFYSVIGFTLFLLINFLLSSIPVVGAKPEGIIKSLPTSKFVANGWISFIFSFLIFFGLEFYGVPIVDYVYDHYFHLTVTALCAGFLFSLVLYLKSWYVPVSSLNFMGDTNTHIYDFLIGREVAPLAFGRVHLKVYLLRIAYIGKALLATAILVKSSHLRHITKFADLYDVKALNLDYTVLLACDILVITSLDKVFFEKTLADSFELKYEGHGYWANMYYLSSIFLYGLVPKYVYDNAIKLDNWILIATFVAFAIFAALSRACSNQKYLFRVNPYSPIVAHFETVPAIEGKQLLGDGYWGIVRHPNYFAEILIHLCLVVFVWSAVPAVYVTFVIVSLFYRASRVEYRARRRYSAAWERYCQRVKYLFVPKVY